jgi:hypothetical protein
MIRDTKAVVGQFFGDVELETCLDDEVSRPRVRPVNKFPKDMRTEFPRALRDMFPIGTRFRATVKVCQKTMGGKAHGPPYLKAYDIALIPASVPDQGLVGRVRKGSINGLTYDYHWTTRA